MKDYDRPVEFETAGGQLLKLSMSITRNIITAAVAATIALPTAASAAESNAREYNCVVSQTVKPRPNRWLSVGNGRFLLVSNLANGNKAAFSGGCTASNGMPPALQRPPMQPSSTWTVPIQRQGKAIILNGTLNDAVPVRWMLDTGASLSTIPQEMADRLRARVVDARNFQLADGRVITANVVVIAKVSVGGVSASNVRAAVSGYGTDPLLGKNFLDAFGSYEINNRSGQLVLRR